VSVEKHANIRLLQMLVKIVFYLADVEKDNAHAVKDVWSAKPDDSSNKRAEVLHSILSSSPIAVSQCKLHFLDSLHLTEHTGLLPNASPFLLAPNRADGLKKPRDVWKARVNIWPRLVLMNLLLFHLTASRHYTEPL
jgi:hypothetical protein